MSHYYMTESEKVLVIFLFQYVFRQADMAELADAPDLGSGGRPCRFKSCYPQTKEAVFSERSEDMAFFILVYLILQRSLLRKI